MVNCHAAKRADDQRTTVGFPINKPQMLRALWRLAAAQLGHATAQVDDLAASLAPREQETLDLLLRGRSEKEIAVMPTLGRSSGP